MTTISFYTRSGSGGTWNDVIWNESATESNIYLQLIENRRKWSPVVRCQQSNNKKLLKFISMTEYKRLMNIGIPSIENKSLMD